MNIEIIDKWLDEEYGCSYTRLDELLEFYTEREMEYRERINKAIEYIERALKDDYSEFMYMYEPEEILKILKGED